MSWAKVSDGLHDHPKVERLLDEDELRGLAALGLWVLGMSYAADHLTDGRVARARIPRIAPRTGKDLATRLVRSGLWEPTEDGFTYHDWADCNPSGADLERVREARSRGGKATAAKRWGTAPPPREATASPIAASDSSSYAGSSATRVRSRPVPSRPVPERDQDPTDPVGSDGQATLPTTPPDPWSLVPDGEDPDGEIGKAFSSQEKPATKGAHDLAPAELSPAERSAYDALIADPTISPIVPRPARLARDLIAAAPAVDVPHEIRRAGAWMRSAGAKGKKKNGAAFVTRWVDREQEHGGTRGGAPHPPVVAPEPAAPERRPPPKAPPVPRVIAEGAARLLAEGGDIASMAASGLAKLDAAFGLDTSG